MKFGAVDGAADLGTLRQKFAPIAQSFGMAWTIRSRSQPQRVLLLASKFDHCLADLLYRWRLGELAMEPVGVASNHPRVTSARIAFGDIPFHHLPVSAATKAAQEGPIREIIYATSATMDVLGF